LATYLAAGLMGLLNTEAGLMGLLNTENGRASQAPSQPARPSTGPPPKKTGHAKRPAKVLRDGLKGDGIRDSPPGA